MIDFNKNNQNNAEETLNKYNQEVTTLLGELLENKDEEFITKLMTMVFKLGINPNDPIFVILGALGNLEFLIEQAPAALQQQFTEWRVILGSCKHKNIKRRSQTIKRMSPTLLTNCSTSQINALVVPCDR